MIALLFFVINSLFWGLAHHDQHCAVSAVFGMAKCPPHWVHILIGVLCFFVAVYISQKEYFDYLLSR